MYTEGGNKMKFKKRLALALATFMVVTSLSACGGKETPSESGTETPSGGGHAKLLTSNTISEAFAQESIWFRKKENQELGKDTQILAVYAFDGKGNVTVYNIGDTYHHTTQDDIDYEPLRFGDLRDLSDKEILELVKEKNKAWFEAIKQTAITRLDSPDYQDYDKSTVRDKWEQLEYESETFQQPFTLAITTDGTGNQTAEERLCYTTPPATAYPDSDVSILAPYDGVTSEIELHPTSGSYVVYDMTFMGCGELYQIRDEGEFGWGLDTPDTKGIEVD